MADAASTLAPSTLTLDAPRLTEELVRYLRRLGFDAREVDYAVIEVESATREVDLDACLAIWERVHAPARVGRTRLA